MSYSRFALLAWPWHRAGANVIPITPGTKKPAVSGFGRSGATLSGQLGLGDEVPLNVEGAPQIPWDAIARWDAQYPGYDCAVFPATVGLTVVDVDDPAMLDDVLRVCGDTPYRTMSGREGGGVHLWYRGTSKSTRVVAGRVDSKSTGGYVLAPGSLHAKTGREYAATPELQAALGAADFAGLPRIPGDWIARLQAEASKITRVTAAEIRELIDTFRRRRESEHARRFRALLDGQAWAEPGARDSTLYSMLGQLAQRYPAASADSVVALFEASAATMEAEHPVDVPIVEAARAKWERIAGRANDDAEREAENTERLRRVAWSWVQQHGRAETCSRGSEPLVVHHGRSYFVRSGFDWAGPWTREEITPDVLMSLEALYGLQIPDVATLLRGYGERASAVEHTYEVKRTRYDPETKVMQVAAGVMRRDLVPEYSEAVHRILCELGGQYAGHLMWWLASFGTDAPCRALVLSGAPGRGKSLLLDGIGQLWPDGAAKAIHVLGKKFNAAAVSSRLAVADDETGASEAGEALAAYLREAVNARIQSVERKHHDVAKVRGSLRFAIATNDVHALIQGAVSHSLNDASVLAFGDRLLHIPIPDSAKGCWERAGVTGDDLVAGGMIARHVLWLAEQEWEPMGGDRFWVGAADEELVHWLRISSGLRGDILLRVWQELEQGHVPTSPPDGPPGLGAWLYRPEGSDVVWVSASGLFASWGDDRPRRASVRLVGQALRGLAAERSCRPKNSALFHAINVDVAKNYATFCGC